MNCQATWEDEENNRQIRFTVNYRIEDGTTLIEEITPTKVSFVCPESNTVLRSIGIWTDTGRRLLSNRFRSSESFDQLRDELARRETAELIV